MNSRVKAAILSVICFSSSLYLLTDAYWESIIVTKGRVLLVQDGFSWWDLGFTSLLAISLLIMGATYLRQLRSRR
ncbi:MAG: hypothetical protein LYZ70_07365 [Nitrososphaerales archaeon]|nr:hypothetical protein [Nitrososphaerales archaeon]